VVSYGKIFLSESSNRRDMQGGKREEESSNTPLQIERLASCFWKRRPV
jgi:hypothetical protein